MTLYLYYIVLAFYALVLTASVVYYLSRRAPTGDASVGWALGFFYSLGLAIVVLIAAFLRDSPAIGLAVLSVPPLFLLMPRIRKAMTDLYAYWPVPGATPPLMLRIKNSTNSMLHVKLECWFGHAKSHSSRLYTTLDYYLAPLGNIDYQLSTRQTRLLAHKSKYVSISIYEQVREEYEDHTIIREIQPCLKTWEENPEAFCKGVYVVEI